MDGWMRGGHAYRLSSQWDGWVVLAVAGLVYRHRASCIVVFGCRGGGVWMHPRGVLAGEVNDDVMTLYNRQ